MDKLEIQLHPIFLIFAFVLIYFGWTQIFLTYLIVLFLHEYSHYFVAKKLGYKLNKILFMPYGVSLNGSAVNMSRQHEFWIALAGPLCNIILAIVSICLWWCFPATYFYTENFVMSNLSLGLFNLLPFFPMDGGRLLVATISGRVSKLKVLRAMKIVSIVGGLVFAILFVVSAFGSVNLTLFFISTFLFASTMDGNNSFYYERVDIEKNSSKPLPMQTYVVSKDTNIYELVKLIKGNNYTQFCVVENGKIIKTLTEKEILNLIQK